MTTHEPTTPKSNRRIIVTRGATQGWEVREERDDRVVRLVTYTDWHRVERALAMDLSEGSNRPADEPVRKAT
jgi:hypothetical protein